MPVSSTPGTSRRSSNSQGLNSIDIEDRYNRIVEENIKLKKERNDLKEKLKILKSQFQKLTTDLSSSHLPTMGSTKQGAEFTEPNDVRNRSGDASVKSISSGAEPREGMCTPDRSPNLGTTLESIEATPIKAVAGLEHSIPPIRSAAEDFQSERARLLFELRTLQEKNRVLEVSEASARSQLASEARSISASVATANPIAAEGPVRTPPEQEDRRVLALSDYYKQQINLLAEDLGKYRNQQLDDIARIERIQRERDDYAIRLRRAEARLEEQECESTRRVGVVESAAASASSAAERRCENAERELAQRTKDIEATRRKLLMCNEELESLKREYASLIEISSGDKAKMIEMKREITALSNERARLLPEAQRAQDLERQLRLREGEFAESERRVMNLIEKVNTVPHELEDNLRLEYEANLHELRAGTERAASERARAERELVEVRLDVERLRRRIDTLSDENRALQTTISTLEAERHRFQRGMSSGSEGVYQRPVVTTTPPETNSPKSNQAVSMAKMLKRQEDREMGSNNTPAGLNDVDDTVEAMLAMYEGLRWSEGWESEKLREVVSMAQVDLNLAAEKLNVMEQKLAEKTSNVTALEQERNELLDENLELRARCTQIQTTLASKYMKRLGALSTSKDSSTCSLVFEITRVDCASIAKQLLNQNTPEIIDEFNSPFANENRVIPQFFFTLDGLDGFETVISNTFYPLCGPDGCSVAQVLANGRMDPITDRDVTELTPSQTERFTFIFENIDPQEFTFEKLTKTTLTIQLHQCQGLSSSIVAAGTISGAMLLKCGYDGNIVLNIPLYMYSVLSKTDALHDSANANEDIALAGNLEIVISAPTLLLPIVMGMRDRRGTGVTNPLTGEDIRAALIQLRRVHGINIQVFSIQDLPIPPPLSEGGSSAHKNRVRPYVFYVSCVPNSAPLIHDTIVTATSCTEEESTQMTDSTGAQSHTYRLDFAAETARCHEVTPNAELVHFLNDGSVVFAIFNNSFSNTPQGGGTDMKSLSGVSSDSAGNLGVAVVSLAPLLELSASSLGERVSNQAKAIIKEMNLYPRGRITVGISLALMPL